MASGELAPSVGDLLTYSSATISVILDPDPGVNWTGVCTIFVGLAAALTLYALRGTRFRGHGRTRVTPVGSA